MLVYNKELYKRYVAYVTKSAFVTQSGYSFNPNRLVLSFNIVVLNLSYRGRK